MCYKTFEKEKTDEETGEQEIVKGFVLKSSSVFNANQVDGFKIPEIETSQTATQLDNVEIFIKKTGARILYRDSFARYQPITDLITMIKIILLAQRQAQRLKHIMGSLLDKIFLTL